MTQVLLLTIAVYAALGLLFAGPFLLRGITVINAAAAASPRSVRLLFLPGVVAVWPVLLMRWVGSPRARADRAPEGMTS